MADWGYENIPGLFSPAENNNTRMRTLLMAGAALAKAGGPSTTPPSWGAGLGNAIEAGVGAYDKGQEHALKNTFTKEQILKLQEERKQAAMWQAMFGTAQPGGAALPAMPQGGPQNAPMPGPVAQAAPPGANGPLPQQPGLLKPGQPFYNTQGAVPVNEPTSANGMPVSPGSAAPGSIPRIAGSRADIQQASEGGIQQVLATMPPAMRQMIAIAGPTKGKELLAEYLGKKPDKPSTTLVSIRGADNVVRSYRADDPAIDGVLNAGGVAVTNHSADGPAEKKPDNYLLKDGTTVLSKDGETYKDATGKAQPIPHNAIKLGADTAYEAARTAEVAARAKADLAGTPPPATRPPAEASVEKGTGTWSNVQSAVNAIAGGLGVDKAVGKKGFFPENEANRQYLEGIKQQAKTAFVNNPRFPVAEQKNIDGLMPDPGKFWANPATEALKIPNIRNMLREQLSANNEAIANGGLSKEAMGRLTSNNIETKKALRLFGDGDESLKALGIVEKPAKPGVGRVGEAFDAAAGAAAPTKDGDRVATSPLAVAPQHGATAWARLPVGGTVRQGTVTYRKKADGSAEEVK